MKPQWKEIPSGIVSRGDLSEDGDAMAAHAAVQWAAAQAGVVPGPFTETTDRLGSHLAVGLGMNLTPARTWVAATAVPGASGEPFRLLSVGLCGLKAYWDLQPYADAEWATGLAIMPPPPV